MKRKIVMHNLDIILEKMKQILYLNYLLKKNQN
jgi:hypothetical protein